MDKIYTFKQILFELCLNKDRLNRCTIYLEKETDFYYQQIVDQFYPKFEVELKRTFASSSPFKIIITNPYVTDFTIAYRLFKQIGEDLFIRK